MNTATPRVIIDYQVLAAGWMFPERVGRGGTLDRRQYVPGFITRVNVEALYAAEPWRTVYPPGAPHIRLGRLTPVAEHSGWVSVVRKRLPASDLGVDASVPDHQGVEEIRPLVLFLLHQPQESQLARPGEVSELAGARIQEDSSEWML